MKKWFQSKLVWSSILKIVGGVGISTGNFLAGDIDPQTLISGLGMAMWGVFDVIARFKTTKEIQ